MIRKSVSKRNRKSVSKSNEKKSVSKSNRKSVNDQKISIRKVILREV